VLLLKHELTPDERNYLLRTPLEHAVASLHLGYGTSIRNRFKLWGGGNPALMASCGVTHPDDCSGIILDHLWQSVRADGDPELVRRLDCQFKLVGQVDINFRGFDELTIGKMLQSVQEQIDTQIATLSKSSPPPCQSALRLEPTGNLDLNCFVRAEFAKEKSTQVKLDKFWGWIGWRNGFEVLNYPPNIQLRFMNKCTWPARPNF
jgi:hypothetical protein